MSRWYNKSMSRFCGTSRMLERYKFQNHSNCPRCNFENEGTLHVLQCTHNSAIAKQQKEIEDLVLWMQKEKVCPDIVYIARTILLWWGNQQQIHPLQGSELAAQAFQQQQIIGWHNFFKGFWSKKFLSCQESYFLQLMFQNQPCFYCPSFNAQIKRRSPTFDIYGAFWTKMT